MKPTILYEDNDVLIIDKPAGIVMHPFDFSNEETLLDIVARYAPEILTIDNQKKLQDGRTINLGGMVHKLDRETSGVVIFAKNKNTFDDVSLQFKNHEIKKIYLAKVKGAVQGNTFTIDVPLARSKKSYKQTGDKELHRGESRNAVTHLEVILHCDNDTLVKLVPETGRTHQLRAHMAHIGHPIIGDIAYGGPKAERIMLHAKSIEIMLRGEKKLFEPATPETFRCLK